MTTAQQIRTIVKDTILPPHLSVEELIDEASQYAESYKCSLELAVRDVIDEYHQGAAEEADARRNGDWDYGRE